MGGWLCPMQLHDLRLEHDTKSTKHYNGKVNKEK